MSKKLLPENNLEYPIFRKLEGYSQEIQKIAPNLSTDDYPLAVHLVMGYHLGRCTYFGLTFPLQESSHIKELTALSNGYIEIKDGAVKMGVIDLESLAKILVAPYLEPRSVRIS